MKKKFGIFFLTVALFTIIGTTSTLASECNCVLQLTAGNSTSLVPVGCDPTTEVGRCEGSGDPTKGAEYKCYCDPAEPNKNCTPEGRVPTVWLPCCPGTFSFEFPSGAICLRNGTNPYDNCISEGEPYPGQTCCAGSKLENGKCVLASSSNTSKNVLCEGDPTGINTAIGCIHVLNNPESFLADILRWATGIGSGIAFLLMLYAGFMIMTAQGNPERLKAGQELLTSAISGLILLILSVFVLKFIGVDILGLNKFGFGQ